jgi:Fe-S cluster biogenesis protein NfuA
MNCHVWGKELYMFIQTERTPNPATLKFLPGVPVLEGGTRNFTDEVSAQGSPLATSLFDLGDVTGVFFGQDFITVTRGEDGADWNELKVPVLAAIMQHFTSGAPLLIDAAIEDDTAIGMADDPADADIIVQIKELIETKVRPAVARDGGDIVYHGFQKGVVYLQMQGSCSGCPSSTATLKGGIESLLKHYVPEVTDVRAI